MSDALTYERFSALTTAPFRVHDGAGNVYDVVLAEISEKKLSAHQESFSLYFRGPSEFFLPQGMYGFEHDTIPMFDLFIVPVSQDADGYTYEAVFNRLLQP
jgi:hypothetical protein